jgi:hypothetical protein
VGPTDSITHNSCYCCADFGAGRTYGRGIRQETEVQAYFAKSFQEKPGKCQVGFCFSSQEVFAFELARLIRMWLMDPE